MGNMREKAKVLQPTVINGNGNDSEEYFFFFFFQFAAAAISPSLETEFDDSRTAFLCPDGGDPNQFSNHMANNSRKSTRKSTKNFFNDLYS